MAHDQISLEEFLAKDEPRPRPRRRPVVLAAAAILLLAVTGWFVSAGLRNGRLASVVEGLKSAVGAPVEATTDTRKDEGTKGAAAAPNTAAGAATARGPRRSAARVASASATRLRPRSWWSHRL